MPLYEYECRKCGLRSEELQKMSDAPLTACSVCGGDLRKLHSAPAIKFKGSGFYINDYAKSGASSKSEGSSTQSEGAGSTGSESKSGSGESKSGSGESKSRSGESKSGSGESKPAASETKPSKASAD